VTKVLFVYSGEVPGLNTELRNVLGPKHTLTTIPFSPYELAAANEDTAYFRYMGFNAKTLSRACYQDAECLRKAVLSSDALYLMGGNTYEFLAYARDVGLFDLLTEFERQGGVIVSESAGSIILSPDISTAAIPTSYPDINTTELTEFSAMGRIPFHISPHYDPVSKIAQKDIEELQTLADATGIPVVVLEDGEGFIMKGQEIVYFLGNRRVLEPNSVKNCLQTPPILVPSWTTSLYT